MISGFPRNLKSYVMRKQLLLPGLLAILLFTGCRKETPSFQQDAVHSEAISKVNTWLDKQSATGNGMQARSIQALRDKLEFTGLWFEELNQGEKLIVVPVGTGLETLYNKGKHPVNVLLLIQNTAGAIRKGNIVQYLPENGASGIARNTFFRFYNDKPLETDATFSFLTLTGRLLYEMKYKDGKMNSFGMATPKNAGTAVTGPVQDPIGPAPVCTDWYLVTTYFYADGTTEQTEEYLYTTCEAGGGGGGGNGNGNDNEAPVFLSAQKDWRVAQNTYGLWFVVSNEQFNGVKVPGELGGGHFTGMAHLTSAIISISNDYTWQELGATASFNATIATSTVSGKVTHVHLGHTYISPTSCQWVFPTIFP